MYIFLGIIALLAFTAVLYFYSKGKGEQNNSDADAKRLARLLVSEIKLYNADKVQRGLQNKNLSDSLRGEIDEARRLYKKQITNPDFEAHFDDAVIEILADGDKSKLDAGFKSTLK